MTSEKFCPICKHINSSTAAFCSFCSASLAENTTGLVAANDRTARQLDVSTEDILAFMDTALIPECGVGIHIAGVPKPYYVAVTHDLIIGREMHAASGAMLDLSELDAFNMGVSRRHAMLRRTDSGFELLDLFSRNGTWLNSLRLSPNKPYPFQSGSQVRLGRMHLVIAYHVRERVR